MGGRQYIMHPVTQAQRGRHNQTPRPGAPGHQAQGNNQEPSGQRAPERLGPGQHPPRPDRHQPSHQRALHPGRYSPQHSHFIRSTSEVLEPIVPPVALERSYTAKVVDSSINDLTAANLTMPSVDLGDITHATNEADSEMPEMMDDVSEYASTRRG